VERVDRPDRGGVFVDYLQRSRSDTRSFIPAAPAMHASPPDATQVLLTNYEPEGETRVAAAILFELGDISDEAAWAAACNLSVAERRELIYAYVGPRSNRRHRPGRAFERIRYRFEVVADYGAFRDLQRHRLLTIEWQQLTPHLGYDLPPEIVALGPEAEREWRSLMDEAAALYETLRAGASPAVAQYVVPMAYRIRFVMDMNAREAMHVIELRTSEQAHPNYRRVCLEMHRLIAEQAGHRLIAGAVRFVGGGDGGLERLSSEQRIEARRSALAAREPS
ncbi:MAG TPA: FAD-dependent thymidylate synthase, partial [Dehalococcoidia bacterium]|nr:FAD-dependent thymidylate synthase [Dehalococcoidia bacterium]